jgi:hypothetical protein
LENNVNNEFENITAIHIVPLQKCWEVRIFEKDFSYKLDQYDNFDFAYEQAKITKHMCLHDVSIFIIADDGSQIQLTNEKMTHDAAVTLFLKSIHTLYIYLNQKTDTWELYTFTRHNTQSVLKVAKSVEEIADFADTLKKVNPDIQIIIEDELDTPVTFDNTCRARQCKWNINDTCILLPRDTSLPLPTADYTQPEWTEVNSMVPGSCQRYEHNA